MRMARRPSIPLVKLTASDGGMGDNFGHSVSIAGNYAAIGAPRDDENSGSAYVFVYDGDGWTEQAKLIASDRELGDKFGWRVAIDGNYAIVGAQLSTDENSNFSGAAYVFKRDGDTWTQQAKLTADGGIPGDRFGYSVAIAVNLGLQRLNHVTPVNDKCGDEVKLEIDFVAVAGWGCS